MTTKTAEKTMAIMTGVSCGAGDRGFEMRCALYVNESLATAHGFYGDEIAAVVEAYDVYDVRDMEGKPCWVDLSDPGLIKWVGPCLIRKEPRTISNRIATLEASVKGKLDQIDAQVNAKYLLQHFVKRTDYNSFDSKTRAVIDAVGSYPESKIGEKAQ